jgi:acetyl-CoA C-acetyltransferase
MSAVYILSVARTPIAGFMGELSGLSAPQLGSHAMAAALARVEVPSLTVEEVLMGCVLPAGLGQAPARQAALGAGLGKSVPCTTVNKVCGSGLKAVMLGAAQLAAGEANIVVAGGMESMSNAPYLLPKMRAGQRLGHGEAKDHMFLDGLEDAYDKGRLMGSFADNTAKTYGLTRDAQDAYALLSLERARSAQQSGAFKNEIAPITVKSGKTEMVVDSDEQPRLAKPEKIPQLKPAFSPDGTVTAANASSISDGAAAVVLASEQMVHEHKLKPMARIIGYCSAAQEPALFTTAPVAAITKLLQQVGWQAGEVDLYEINEAFALVAMIAAQEIGIPSDKLNTHGGACALGHPIGASGARLLVTLLYALQLRGQKRGVVSLCIGGGEAVAMAVEMV